MCDILNNEAWGSGVRLFWEGGGGGVGSEMFETFHLSALNCPQTMTLARR